MRRRGRTLVAAAVAAVAVLAVAVIASADVPDGDGVIHACYVTSSGTIRIVDPATGECKRGETPIEWGVQGPPGDPGAGVAGFVTTFGPVAVPTANVSTPPLVVLSGLPEGPSFATATIEVSNASGGPVTLICTVGEQSGAYSFPVPGNPGGPGPYQTVVTIIGRSGSSGVPFGCHVWGDPGAPVAGVTISGEIQATALSSLTPG